LPIEVGELTPKEAAVALASLPTGKGPTRLFFPRVASGVISREDDALSTEGELLGAAMAKGSRVESFLVGSPTWVEETGVPTFTNTEVGRFLRSSWAGRRETGVPRVVAT
jgi:hypothetical protein